MSAHRGGAEIIATPVEGRILTQMYGPAVRCKRFSSSWRLAVLHQCIRPLIGAFAPGHHGYQRACVLINGQASTGHQGHQCSHAPERLILHLYLSSRRPRLETVDRTMSSLTPHFSQFLCSSLALQLRFLKGSESMGNHDSNIVDACCVD